MTSFDPMAEPPDEDEETASDRAMRAHFEALDREDRSRLNANAGAETTAASEGTAGPKTRKAKEPMLKQFLVTVFVNEESHVAPTATVDNARDEVWRRYSNTDGRFRVTRAEARTALSDEDEGVDFDQLRFVCDYVAKGANADDVKKRIAKALDDTGISHWGMNAVETASLRAAEPWAVPEDLPSLEELRRRVE